MKTGDKLKIISNGVYIKGEKTLSVGVIAFIDSYKVTMKKNNGFLESFTFNDFIAEDKKIFINGQEVKIKMEGGKYVLCKITRRDN